MLLNHKEAIEFMVDAVPTEGITVPVVRNVQSLLVNADLNLTHFALDRRSKTDPPGAVDSRCSAAQGVARSG